ILARALLAQLLPTAAGLSMIQLLKGRERIRWLPLLPYAWGVGVVLLYLCAQVLVRTDLLVGSWHLAAAAGMAALSAAGGWRYLRAAPTSESPGAELPWRWYDGVLVALILSRVGLVAWLNGHDPIFDSDATLASGYATLAKRLGEGMSARD